MAESKTNGGSSYKNQGDRQASMKMGSGGANLKLNGYSAPAKDDAKAWKSKSKSNPSVPDYLA